MDFPATCSGGEACFIGRHLSDTCHLQTYSRKVGFLLFSIISENDRRLVLWRTGISVEPSTSDTLCFHHENLFLSRCESLQKFCRDPFSGHKKHVTKSLRVVNVELAELLQVKPGQKLCKRCEQRISNKEENASESNVDYKPDTCDVDAMNHSVLALGCSPLKSVSEHDKVGYAERKIKRMQEATKAKMAGALALSAEALEAEYIVDMSVGFLSIIGNIRMSATAG